MNKTLRSILFWLLAFVIASAFMVYQRMTGPTYELRGDFTLAGKSYRYDFQRSHELAPDESGSLDHTVRVTVPDSAATGVLHWKRLGVDEPFTSVAMQRVGDDLIGTLPHQPAAGKLVYHVTLQQDGEAVELPSRDETVTIRFKGAVPLGILLPHVLAMVFVMLLSVRAAIAALAGEPLKGYAWASLIVLLIGGFVLGPSVQKFAFDQWWTGWPFGEDLTDNKTLAAAIAWVIALLQLRRQREEKRARWWVLGAAVVVLAVYTIPHSMGGSTFDYAKGEITTGAVSHEPARTGGEAGTPESGGDSTQAE